jgi:hypothetical protein
MNTSRPLSLQNVNTVDLGEPFQSDFSVISPLAEVIAKYSLN